MADAADERPLPTRLWPIFPFVVLLGLLCMQAGKIGAPEAAPRPVRTVRVAAVQFHSVMGDPAGNRERLVTLVERAAAGGARIVVLPEAAIPGYADLSTDTFWSGAPGGEEGYLSVAGVAESVPGASTEFFAPLTKRLGVYLTVPVIERAEGGYFNTVALLSPEGEVAVVHRKHVAWPVADSFWMKEGPKAATVVETPHGRLGLMICRDVHALLPLMREAGADIVLYCVAFLGPNSGDWFETTLAAKVADQGVSLVLANWTFPEDPGWSGWGASCVISPAGDVLARAERAPGDQIVFADVPCGEAGTKPPPAPPP